MTKPVQMQKQPPIRPLVLQNFPGWLLSPIPLVFLQPVLQRLVLRIAHQRPDLFDRLGVYKDKRYLIEPANLPFAFLLCPNPEQPKLFACRRKRLPQHDAKISASFLTLLAMIDGCLDGDAIFFNRNMIIEGDIEAVVVLRNAIDDLEGSIADDLAGHFGKPAKAALAAIRRIGSRTNGQK